MNFEGWYLDPYGLHEARWISDGVPTSLVSDHGLETDDEPPEGTPVPTTFEPVPEAPVANGLDLARADELRSAEPADGSWAAPGTSAAVGPAA